MGAVIVDSAVYRQGKRIVDDLPPSELGRVRKLATEPGDFVWVGLHEPTEDELATVEEEFGLHPLAVEDAFNAHQRPKLERYEDTLFLILKSLWYVDANDAVETGEINMFVGHDFVVTVRHGAGLGAALRAARPRGEVRPCSPTARRRSCTPCATGSSTATCRWSSSLEEDVDEVEASVFSPQRTNDSARIYTLKREIAEVRRAVLPLREPMRRFATGAVPGIDEAPRRSSATSPTTSTAAAETVDALDQLLSTAFDAHLAQISVQQNEDMRKISAGVGLVAAPTLIAGVYGMNFEHMPELGWLYGYPTRAAR